MTACEIIDQKAAFALVELGMPRDEFLRLTPRQWQMVLDQFEITKANREELANRRTARLCYVFARCLGNELVTEQDFMPVPVDMNEQEPEEMEMVLRSLGERNNG